MDDLTLKQVRTKHPETFSKLESLDQRILTQRQVRLATDASGAGSKRYWLALADQLQLEGAKEALARKYVGEARPATPTVGDLQRVMAEDEAYVGWFRGSIADEYWQSSGDKSHTLWAFVVRKSGPVRWIELHSSTGTPYWPKDHQVATFGLQLLETARLGAKVEISSEFLENARLVGDLNFLPIREQLEGVTQLTVQFSGTSARPQFQTLMDEQGVFLAHRYAMSYVPCAVVKLMLTRGHAKQRREESFVGVGFPDLGNADLWTDGTLPLSESVVREAVSGDLEALRKLPPLPNTRLELEEIAEWFGTSQLYLAERATKQSLDKSHVEGADILHFATHALFTSERCALVLTPSDVESMDDVLLVPDEVHLGWNLDADLVTLSSCQTASDTHGTEPWGFHQAFFAAGAKSVLSSWWKVNDRATYLLMTRFYTNLLGNYDEDRGWGAGWAMTKAQALQEAKRFVYEFEEDGERPFAHPVYWAGFTLMGAAN